MAAEDGVDVRVRFVIYRDITVGSSEDTVWSNWFTKDQKAEAVSYLEGVRASDGGDGPETVLDGLGKILSTDFFKRTDSKDAAKFCVVLTDADYKLNNKFGYGTDTAVVDKLTEEKIHTSVVTRTAHFTDYAKFLTAPTVDSADDGGILADIYGDYSILLKDLAKKIVTVVGEEPAVKIKSSMIVLRKHEGYQYECAKDTDAPDDAETYGAKQSSCVFKDLQPSTKYVFRVYDSAGNLKYTYHLKTESSTGARFNSIPFVLHEGEVYNIKVDGALKDMVVTSGASINWSCSSDCVKVTNDDVGYGCQMIIRDCEYNNNKLLKVTLVADVEYSIKNKNGKYTLRSQTFKKTFSLDNEIDAIDIGEFHGTSENTYKDGIIVLGTKDKVWIDIVLNQGEAEDTPSKQKMTYMISDKYGFKNSKGTKIAKVSSKGILTGVNPGVTYLTIGPAHEYNRYGNTYNYSVTIPVICPHVDTVKFNTVMLSDGTSTSTSAGDTDEEDPKLVLINDSIVEDEPYYVVEVTQGSTLELTPYLIYNPSLVFNSTEMKKKWASSDTSIAKITSGGKISFKQSGYTTVSMVPEGGYEIDVKTGKRKVETKPCSITFKVLPSEKK